MTLALTFLITIGLLAVCAHKLVGIYRPHNERNTWPRAFVYAFFTVVLGLITFVVAMALGQAWLLTVGGLIVPMGMLVGTYRIDWGLAAGIYILTAIISALVVLGFTFAATYLAHLHPLLPLIVTGAIAAVFLAYRLHLRRSDNRMRMALKG